MELLVVLALKAAQDDAEYYRKAYVEKIQNMSPKAARCLKMIVGYGSLSSLDDYQSMRGAINGPVAEWAGKQWVRRSVEQRRFAEAAEAVDLTPEDVAIGFGELAKLELLTGGLEGKHYRLSLEGLSMVRALQIELTPEQPPRD